MIDNLRKRYEQLQGLLNTPANQSGGLLGNISQGALLGSAIYSQGVQGKDPFAALFPAVAQTAQMQQLLTPKQKDRKMVKDVEGRQRYADTGELVFPDVKISENSKSKSRLLSEKERIDQGFDKTDVVQIDPTGNRKVLKQTPAGEKAKAATRKTVLSSINKIVNDVDKVGTGFFEARLKGLFTPFSPTQAKFRADTKQLELNVIKALRGAQVSAAEEDNVRQILPQVTDSEVTFKAKAESLREYLQELDTRIEGGIISKESKVLKKKIEPKNKFKFSVGDDGIYDVTGG
jgi:hypothetical protein